MSALLPALRPHTSTTYDAYAVAGVHAKVALLDQSWTMVQAPLPAHIRPSLIYSALRPDKDVDGFHPVNMGKLLLGDENGFVFFEQAIELCRSGEPALRLEADVYREYARFRMTMGDDAEARAYLERARELLEPFGDEAAREKIDQELQRLSS